MKRILYLLLPVFCSFSQISLFAQCCSFSYQQQVEPPTSAATFGVALGDLDGDGDKDAAAISAYYGIDIYFNNGSGTFTLNAQYATQPDDDFYGVHIVDVDGDNDLDVIAIPFYSSANLTILKNNGSGVFTVSNLATNIACYNAAVGDVDGDGDVDVFLPNASGSAGKVVKNNGNGVFSVYQAAVTNARGYDADLGDLDGDGDLDAFVTDQYSVGNSVFLNNGSGTFTQFGSNFGTTGGYVALGDLDGDGDLDAWVGNPNNYAEIYLNNGSAVFTLGTTVTTHPTWGYCKAVNLYDFDGDGDKDVFLGFYSHYPQVWINNGNLNFSLCYQAPVGSSCHGQAIGDLNNDGKIDIYSGYFSNNDGDYVFLNTSVQATIEYKNSPFCSDNPTPQSVTLTGAGGGTFSASPAGLLINSATGTITPSGSNPGTYTVTYTVSGCAFTTTVEIVAVDLSTSLNGATITANQSGASYQWVNCNNGYQPVPGAQSQSFTPAANGNYAVIISYGPCTDTSLCVNITTVGTDEKGQETIFNLYPNPATGMLYFNTSAQNTGCNYYICDVFGRMIYSGTIDSENMNVDISKLEPGMYFIGITTRKVFIKL